MEPAKRVVDEDGKLITQRVVGVGEVDKVAVLRGRKLGY